MAVAQTKQTAQSAQGLLPSADLATPETTVAEFSKEQELAALRQMLLIRRFEEKAGQMYGMGLIGGFCHLYIGQEAVVVGLLLETPDQQHLTERLELLFPGEFRYRACLGRRRGWAALFRDLIRVFGFGDGHQRPRNIAGFIP